MKSANRLRRLFPFSLLFLALVFFPAKAVDLTVVRKKLAMIELLIKAGRKEEAATQMRSIFPKGPPIGGALALEYYDVIGNTDQGWEEAKKGLEKLVAADPYDLGYKLAFARQLARRSETRHEGMQIFADLSKNPDMKQRVLAEWRKALGEVANDEAGIAFIQDYLAVDPGNADMQDALSVAKRIVAASLPWKLRKQADIQLQAGHADAAMATLEKALKLDPKNPWVRFDLARLFLKKKGEKAGDFAMEKGLVLQPDDPDMLYAYALYLSLDNRPGDALKMLDKIPPYRLSDAMQRLKKEAAARENEMKYALAHPNLVQHAATGPSPWKLRDEASAQLDAGHFEAAKDLLKKALKLDARNPWVRFDLARLYQKGGEQQAGLSLMNEGLGLAPQDAAMLYVNALYIALSDEAENALVLLERIPEAKRSQAMQRLAKEMLVQVRINRAQAAFKNGHLDLMRKEMLSAEREADGNEGLIDKVANTWFVLNNPERGLAIMKPLATTSDAMIDYARLLDRAEKDAELDGLLRKISEQSGLLPEQEDEVQKIRLSMTERMANRFLKEGNIASARGAIAQILEDTSPQDVDKRMTIAGWYLDANDARDARDIVETVKRHAPFDPRVLTMEGRIYQSEGEDEKALLRFKEAGALENLSDMLRHRARAYLETGENYLSKRDGSPGISNLKESDKSVDIHIPYGYRDAQFFVQMDSVSLNAGALSRSATGSYALKQYGQVLAMDPLLNKIEGSAYANPSTQGIALGVGLEKGDFRFDVGTTPRGFPVSYLVGGMKWSHYTATTGFSLDVSRRPVTSSLISYAGAHDPVTGQVWGGVRSTGGSLHFSRSRGPLTGSLDMDMHWLTGTNVLTNKERNVRLGLDWDFIREEDMRLNAGIAVSDWHFSDDLSNYTFGQGGYYSPQKYHSLSLPVRWEGRWRRLSYLLQGSVSVSTSYSREDMPYYPTRPDLQAAAGNPTYSGGSGHGMYYSVGSALEYRVVPQLYVGGRLEVDHTAYYSPNYFTAYLRYMFDPDSGPVPYPPQPIRPYSQY